LFFCGPPRPGVPQKNNCGTAEIGGDQKFGESVPGASFDCRWH
jgi:hypothetical protein